MEQFDTDLYTVKAWDIRWHEYVLIEVWACDREDAMDLVEEKYWYLEPIDAYIVGW